MLHRRIFLNIAAGAWLTRACLVGRAAHADQGADRAEAFVKTTGEKLVGVVNGPGGPQQKQRALTEIIDATVDVDGVAQFCLGRFWRQATPEQQHRYLETFHHVLVSNITSKLGEYQGVRFTVNRTIPGGDTVKVDTTVVRPNNPATNVQWVIGESSSAPKIIDVIAEGTSLRLTQRSDYAAYLSHNNNSIDALIGAMRQQVEQNQAKG